MLLQKLISWFAVAALGFSIVVCPCSSVASDGQMDEHAHHQSAPAADIDKTVDCGHEGCLNDCVSVSGLKSETVVIALSGSVETDDLEMIPVALVSIRPRTVTLTSTGPPLGHQRSPADTPVRRHDRLVI